jgi:hypothetical protein
VNKIEKAVSDHFEEVCSIKNKYGVEICKNSTDSYCLACSVPGFIDPTREYGIELFLEFENVNKLVETFSVTSPNDLNGIKPELLYSFYEKGEALISCIINDFQSFGLDFRKFGSYLFATDNIEENTHAVVSHLQTQEEFYNYTVHFYENVYKKQQ